VLVSTTLFLLVLALTSMQARLRPHPAPSIESATAV
jgi:hypothetical protein